MAWVLASEIDTSYCFVSMLLVSITLFVCAGPEWSWRHDWYKGSKGRRWS